MRANRVAARRTNNGETVNREAAATAWRRWQVESGRARRASGTTTSRFFGSADALLPEFAWFSRHPPKKKDDAIDPADPQRSSAVGRLKPNDLGMFDIYGNVWEWTQDRVERYQNATVNEDREDVVLRVVDQDARTRRGGAFPYEAAMARSAARGTITSLPTNRRDNVGFRVARTLR